jgi:hypothetical protein
MNSSRRTKGLFVLATITLVATIVWSSGRCIGTDRHHVNGRHHTRFHHDDREHYRLASHVPAIASAGR